MPLFRSHESRILRVVVLFYLGMGAVGLVLLWWRRETFAFEPIGGLGKNPPLFLAVTLALGFGIHLASRFCHNKFPTFRAGGRDIRRLLGNLSTPQIALVALASGIGEELLFRGWLYHETGLWISSILFGLIHIPPNRKWLYWPLFAAAMGLLLGWLYMWTAALIYPILLHALINHLNLHLMLPKQTTNPNSPLLP